MTARRREATVRNLAGLLGPLRFGSSGRVGWPQLTIIAGEVHAMFLFVYIGLGR